MKKYLLKFRMLFFCTVSLMIGCAILDVCFAFVLSNIVDVTISKDMRLFRNSILIAVVYLVVNVFISLMHKISKALYLKKTLVELKKSLFSKILSKDVPNFLDESSANYISTLTNDETIIEEDYFNNILQLVYYSVAFIAAFYSLIKVNYNFLITIFIGGALIIVLPQLLGGRLSRLRSLYSSNMAKYTSKLKDIFSGFEVIRGFNVGKKVEEDFNSINEITEKSKYKFHVISYVVDMMSTILGLMLQISVMMVGVYLTIKGKITVGEMIAAVQLMNYIINPLVQSVMLINKMNSTKGIANKMLEIMKMPEDNNAIAIKSNFENEISFIDVSFSYNSERAVLDQVSIKFEKGKKYVIVGASGSGKSTLLKLLLGYYQNYAGYINIDSMELRTVKPDSIYALMCVIQQNVYLFDGTIKENITLYENYSNEQINEAVKLSELDKLVNTLPNGLDTLVGENGSKLSGGERQRISIARAIIKKTPIILLDEATSALDVETAVSIEKAMIALEGTTSVVITHRLDKDILQKYDEIIVMEEGKIVEQGNFDDLLNRKKFLYSMLEQDNCEEVS